MNPFDPAQDPDPNRPGRRTAVVVAWIVAAVIATSAVLHIVPGSDQVAGPGPTLTTTTTVSPGEAVPMCGADDVEVVNFSSDGAGGTQYAFLTFTVIADEPCWPMTIDSAEISTADGPLADERVHLRDKAVQHVDVVRPLSAGERFYIGLQRGSQCPTDVVNQDRRLLTSLRVFFRDETAQWPIEIVGCGGASVSQPSLRPQPDVPLYINGSSFAVSSLEIPVWMPATEPPLPEDPDVSFFATTPRSWVLTWGPRGPKPGAWAFRIEGYDPELCHLPDLPTEVDPTTEETYIVADRNYCKPSNAEIEEMPGLSLYWQDPDQSVTFRARMSPLPQKEGAPMTTDEIFATLASMTQIIDLREQPVSPATP